MLHGHEELRPYTAPTNGSPHAAAARAGLRATTASPSATTTSASASRLTPRTAARATTSARRPVTGHRPARPSQVKERAESAARHRTRSAARYVDEQNDLDNCGGCTTQAKSYACTAPANATSTCAPPAGSPGAPGVCTFSCNLGYQLCNGTCVQADPTAVFVSKSSSATGSTAAFDRRAMRHDCTPGLAYATASIEQDAHLHRPRLHRVHVRRASSRAARTGVTLEGGWIAGGASNWTKVCTANDTLAVIAPTNTSMAAVANGVTATLLVNLERPQRCDRNERANRSTASSRPGGAKFTLDQRQRRRRTQAATGQRGREQRRREAARQRRRAAQSERRPCGRRGRQGGREGDLRSVRAMCTPGARRAAGPRKHRSRNGTCGAKGGGGDASRRCDSYAPRKAAIHRACVRAEAQCLQGRMPAGDGRSWRAQEARAAAAAAEAGSPGGVE